MVAEFGQKCPATVTACPALTQFPWVEEEGEEEPEGLLALEVLEVLLEEVEEVEEEEDHLY